MLTEVLAWMIATGVEWAIDSERTIATVEMSAIELRWVIATVAMSVIDSE